MRLDELLEELQARINAARGTRDRVHSLLEAVVSVGRELDLSQVLRRIVEAGAQLVDAQYGALGVIGPDGRSLSQFLTSGMTREQRERIGPLPAGHGLLGELIRHPEPLRLSELGTHEASFGFPEHHPPMRTFLGVPIRVRDEVFGNLYLTDKRDGLDFDAEDESVITTLAVAAGVAIDNARLYESSQRQHRWLRAGAEVTNQLLSGDARQDVLELIARRAGEITGACLAEVSAPVPGTDDLVVELSVTLSGTDGGLQGLTLPADGTLAGAASAAGTHAVSTCLGKDPRFRTDPHVAAAPGPAVAVPLGAAGAAVLLLVREVGEPAFTEAELEPLLTFAGQAALALELAVRRRDAEHVALLEDRDRIARDLHDLAIQRLFATGMTLQSTARLIEHTGAAERVARAVDDLDETIKIIRSTIFGLRARDEGPASSLRARASRTVGDAVTSLGFPPRLSMEGLLDTDVPLDVAEHVVAALGELLSNAARHAHATRVEVSLKATADEVRLTVADNGRGIPEQSRRSGLDNLAERARQVGGALEVSTPDGGGSRLLWRAPLR
ncbi:GAF domain-containing protein [Streptomyces sp. SID8374]|uniref:GAF domain-containing sensor histidine kinase n=1 Tax=unclassified Streptomyces TaxID=2593676 RepID=UPI0013700DBE|nr:MULTISPECIES: GAF domain-containing sensor histidine kinase [unclassified Streptomyces]MYR98496.1 GAF domain-containing protein [Streptomyces sp. SID4937]MYX12277.1 GAF domain-containing protein [Streptomyces sp. SID8374]